MMFMKGVSNLIVNRLSLSHTNYINDNSDRFAYSVTGNGRDLNPLRIVGKINTKSVGVNSQC